MRITFPAQYPTFGTKNNRKSLGFQERSPYYWWWSYLKRNKDYINCCEKNGKGKLNSIYKHFGDVRCDDFRIWWSEDGRGVKLFAEKPSEIFVKELASKDEWLDHWTKEEVMIVSIPLKQTKREINRYFSNLLKKRHTAKRGRVAMKLQDSKANFPLSRNYTISSLSNALAVYDAYMKAKSSEGKTPLWKIGDDLRLMPTQKLHSNDTPATQKDKKRALAVTVSRYITQAKRSIANTSKGVFP